MPCCMLLHSPLFCLTAQARRLVSLSCEGLIMGCGASKSSQVTPAIAVVEGGGCMDTSSLHVSIPIRIRIAVPTRTSPMCEAVCLHVCVSMRGCIFKCMCVCVSVCACE